jgi:D-aspartate ligase
MNAKFHSVDPRRGQPVAVVTGANLPVGLGGARALHAGGAYVLGITAKLNAATCHARVWKKIYHSGGDLVSTLRSLGSDLEQPAFLLPTQDKDVSTISRDREDLAGIYRFVLPEDEIVQTFLNKTRFYNWARTLGFPLPYSMIVKNEADLLSALKEMPYPLILKPHWRRTPAWKKLSPAGKVLRLESASDIPQIPCDLFSETSHFILSQWIDGPDDSVHYCLAYCGTPGEITKHYTGRKLLQSPRQTGTTAICVGTENGELLELAREVFKQANFEGLGSLEIKYDKKGSAFITEPTVGRPNLQSYSAVAAGCNLQALAMNCALGRESLNGHGSVRNCGWVVETAIFELVKTPNPQPVPWRLLTKELLRAGRLGGAFWDWRDPAVLMKLLIREIACSADKLLSRFKASMRFRKNKRLGRLRN